MALVRLVEIADREITANGQSFAAQSQACYARERLARYEQLVERLRATEPLFEVVAVDNAEAAPKDYDDWVAAGRPELSV
jgi:hypothetical protein